MMLRELSTAASMQGHRAAADYFDRNDIGAQIWQNRIL
jgi:hypothetical protein